MWSGRYSNPDDWSRIPPMVIEMDEKSNGVILGSIMLECLVHPWFLVAWTCKIQEGSTAIRICLSQGKQRQKWPRLVKVMMIVCWDAENECTRRSKFVVLRLNGNEKEEWKESHLNSTGWVRGMSVINGSGTKMKAARILWRHLKSPQHSVPILPCTGLIPNVFQGPRVRANVSRSRRK